MYCQLHRPITSGSQLACFLGHVGDSIYWFQKGVGLPDALGFVPPPYFPLLHIGLTGLVCVLLLKALLLDPFSALTKLTLTRRRGRSGCSGHSTFVRVYLRNAVLVVFELFTLSSIVSMAGRAARTDAR